MRREPPIWGARASPLHCRVEWWANAGRRRVETWSVDRSSAGLVRCGMHQASTHFPDVDQSIARQGPAGPSQSSQWTAIFAPARSVELSLEAHQRGQAVLRAISFRSKKQRPNSGCRDLEAGRQRRCAAAVSDGVGQVEPVSESYYLLDVHRASAYPADLPPREKDMRA